MLLDRGLRWAAQRVLPRPRAALAAAGLLTVASVVLVSRLSIDTDLSNLLPSHYPSVQALEHLRNSVGGENTLDVVIESPSFARNLAFADTLIHDALLLRAPQRPEPFFHGVEFRKNTEFVKQHALYFATPEELDSATVYLERLTWELRRRANPLNRGRIDRKSVV